jgi:type I restriction enzyme, R subunit
MKFTEDKLESAFISLLGDVGIPHVSGKTLVRDTREVLFKEDLKAFLMSQYAVEELTASEADSIIRKLEILPSSDLYESNKAIMRLVVDGFVLKREDATKKDVFIQLIDYTNLANRKTQHHFIGKEGLKVADNVEFQYQLKDNNIYKIVNQLEIQGFEKRIPDAILYINGLPLVVFEFKSSSREDATIHNAYVQLTTRYSRDIPELFKYNAFCVISDGINNKAGSFFAPYEFFYAWRMIEGLEREVDGIDSMYTLVQGMFDKHRLRDIIRNFIILPDSSKKDEKIVCRYPQ